MAPTPSAKRSRAVSGRDGSVSSTFLISPMSGRSRKSLRIARAVRRGLAIERTLDERPVRTGACPPAIEGQRTMERLPKKRAQRAMRTGHARAGPGSADVVGAARGEHHGAGAPLSEVAIRRFLPVASAELSSRWMGPFLAPPTGPPSRPDRRSGRGRRTRRTVTEPMLPARPRQARPGRRNAVRTHSSIHEGLPWSTNQRRWTPSHRPAWVWRPSHRRADAAPAAREALPPRGRRRCHPAMRSVNHVENQANWTGCPVDAASLAGADRAFHRRPEAVQHDWIVVG